MAKKLIIFLIGISIALLTGIYLYNKPRQGVDKLTPVVKITAARLWKEYNENETAADKRYLNAVIELEGVVSEISTNGGGQVLLLSAQSDGTGISCLLAEDNYISGLQPGNHVKVKGRCTGYNMDVNLTDCIIIQ